MNTPSHRFHELFAQLGLPCDDAGIQGFIAANSPLAAPIRLHEAPFWSAAQASFLSDALQQDSDWAELADQLSQALRAPGPAA
jgi:hypothetical protein